MKTFKKLAYILFFLLSFNSFGQNIKKDTTNVKLISAAKEIMIAAGTCALVSLDKEGGARVRTMDPFKPENNLTVWLGTNSKSRKVNQIKNSEKVTLYYLDSDDSSYVIIYGTAQLVNDKTQLEKRWKEKWKDFYPNKTENYLLIKITPIWMEISSTSRGIFGDTKTWQPPRVWFNN